MHIIHIASELAPIAKVGGLGDVLLGLSRELSRVGHDLDIIIPKYDCMDADLVRDLHAETGEVIVEYDGQKFSNTVWIGWYDNLKIYFIEPHHPRLFFNRGCIYGCEDDIERFLYFSLAALTVIRDCKLRPEVIHLHDWHTAVIPALAYERFSDLVATGMKTVYTIHNLEHQGKCRAVDLNAIGMKGDYYAVAERFRDESDPRLINLMKGGIVYADQVTTVSRTYAKEIQTKEGGMGLSQVTRAYSHKLVGIVNGVDYTYWNPETDRYLPTHFSARERPLDEHDRITIDRKAYVKKVLREKLMLDEQHRPIVGCVTRLVPQKGVDLIRHALFRTLENRGQFVLLGSSPISSINKEFHDLMHQFADHPNVRLILKHEEELAHLVFAGSDLFIVPSLFEPCGLTQLIALKYGAVPIVRMTGGLADTIVDVDMADCDSTRKNGYIFKNPTPEDFNSALDRSIHTWFEEPAAFRALMLQGMQMDFSWKKPALEYLHLYERILR